MRKLAANQVVDHQRRTVFVGGLGRLAAITTVLRAAAVVELRGRCDLGCRGRSRQSRGAGIRRNTSVSSLDLWLTTNWYLKP